MIHGYEFDGGRIEICWLPDPEPDRPGVGDVVEVTGVIHTRMDYWLSRVPLVRRLILKRRRTYVVTGITVDNVRLRRA